MATFSVKPTEGQDPWGATDLAWRSSVEAAVNGVESTANAALPIKGQLGTADLNTVLTTGIYFQSAAAEATTARNYPFASVVQAVEVINTGNTVLQRATVTQQGSALAGRGHAQRTYIHSTLQWGEWMFIPSRRTVDNFVGRAVYVWDHTNRREQLDATSETYVFDMSAQLINGWTGTVYLYRRGYEVTCEVEGLVSPTPYVSDQFLLMPQGFIAARQPRGLFHTAQASPVVKRLSGVSGSLAVAGGSTAALYGAVTWKTINAFPTVAPGVRVGDLPSI